MPLDTQTGPVRLAHMLHHAQPNMLIWAESSIEGGAGCPDTTAIPQGCRLYQMHQADLMLPATALSVSHGQSATVSAGNSSSREGGLPAIRSSPRQHSMLQIPATEQIVRMSAVAKSPASGIADLISDPHLVSAATAAGTAANKTSREDANPSQHQHPSAVWQQLQHYLQKWQAACNGARMLPFCYVMYTSGSTGQPAAVCGTEAGQLLCALCGLIAYASPWLLCHKVC